MNSTVLRIATTARPPFVFYAGNRTGISYTGFFVDLLPTLLGYARISATPDYTYYPADEPGELIGGQWTGMMDLLVNGDVDMLLYPMPLSVARIEAVDITSSVVDGGITLLVHKGDYHPPIFGFLRPFSWQVWLALIASVLAVTLAYHLLRWATPFGDFNKLRMRKTNEAPGRVRKYVVASYHESPLCESLLCMMGAPVVPSGGTWSLKLMQLVFAFFSLILLQTYTANLAAMLTVQPLSQPIATIQALLMDQMATLGVVQGLAAYDYLQDTVDPMIQQLKPRMRIYDSLDTASTAVSNKEITALMEDSFVLQYWANTIPCDTETISSVIGPANLGIALPKGSPLLAPLNSAILELRGNGVIDQLKRRWTEDLDQCYQTDLAAVGALQLSALTGLWYMLLLFIVVSFAWIGGEHGAMALEQRYPKATAKMRRLLARMRGVGGWSSKDKRFSVMRKFNSVRRRTMPRRMSRVLSTRSLDRSLTRKASSKSPLPSPSPESSSLKAGGGLSPAGTTDLGFPPKQAFALAADARTSLDQASSTTSLPSLQTVQSGAEADWGEGHDMPSEIELSDPVMARSPSGKPPLGRAMRRSQSARLHAEIPVAPPTAASQGGASPTRESSDEADLMDMDAAVAIIGSYGTIQQ